MKTKMTKATRSTKRIAKKIEKPASARGKNPKTPKTKKTVAAKKQATISNPRRKSSVFLNATPKRSKVVKTARKKPVGKTARKPSEPVVRAVHQPDGVSCGWATTKWLLSAFGLEVPSDRKLERELHVRKGRGIRPLDRNREVQGAHPCHGPGGFRLYAVLPARSHPKQKDRRFLHDRVREIVKRVDAATR